MEQFKKVKEITEKDLVGGSTVVIHQHKNEERVIFACNVQRDASQFGRLRFNYNTILRNEKNNRLK